MRSQVLEYLLKTWQPYFEIDGITEIAINKEKELWLDINGKFEKRIDENITSTFLMDFAVQLATHRNLFFNLNVPHLSCSIPDTNIRVQAQHPSVISTNQLILSIRIPSSTIFDIDSFILGDNLIKNGINYDFFKNLIINRKNILISGGTGSGKTSFINSMLKFLPIEDRIITIEDSAELRINNHNLVSIIVSKNDQSAYSYKDGLNDAMRLRPDRIFVGEIDTRNTMLFLRLSNTGHEGMVSTIHANSVLEAIDAITLNAKFDGSDVEVENLIKYFAKAIDYVIQIKKVRGKGRVIHAVLDVKKHFIDLIGKIDDSLKGLEELD